MLDVAKEEIDLEKKRLLKVLFTEVRDFFLHRMTVSRPTRSMTSRIRSCFSKIRAGLSVFFEGDAFFFHVFEDSVNTISLIVSPAGRKSLTLAI